MFQNKSVNTHQFAMVPRPDVPRSKFKIQTTHKTAFDAGYLVPIYVDEVLPGDTFSLKMTTFCRLATPIAPFLDNVYLDSFFFFVPNRLVWRNWVKFMGQQDNPGDSISYTIPTSTSPVNGYAVSSLQDYFGLPTAGQLTSTKTFTHSSLPLRAYNLIYNEWFRDENMISSVTLSTGDGPDGWPSFSLLRRGKRHDYFTSALPWTQKGTAVTLPLGSSAPVIFPSGSTAVSGFGAAYTVENAAGTVGYGNIRSITGIGAPLAATTPPVTATDVRLPVNFAGNLSATTGIYADLSSATAATVNQLRQSFQIQKLLERDARGGTRYTELVRAHFGVISPDARLQRPEYLGGGSTHVSVNPIAQTSGTGADGQSTPLGNLSAMATALATNNGFTQSFTEHGIIIGLVSARADLTYQQGVRKFWNRSTRYDFYFPAFAMLGEQAILNREIYATGDTSDTQVFGYQERWAEYRYFPSMITGLMKSTAAGTIDYWHLAQRFTSIPTLNSTFINDTPPMDRVLAVGASANGKQFLFDSFFDVTAVRPLPMYSVPGLIDHF